MKKTLLFLNLILSLLWLSSSCNQSTTTDEKMSVEERLAKARAAKAEKRANKASGESTEDVDQTNPRVGMTVKATVDDYKAPIDKVLKGPNGEVVRTGERGAKYYINKNGNKTYLSSNQ